MKKIFLLILVYLMISPVFAQDSLLNTLENETEGQTINYTQNTFKGTRLINGHTVETRTAGSLVFLITHRFGELNSGSYNLWGLDVANIRFGFDYAITDAFTIGVGRSSFDKVFDGFLKYRLTRQCSGARNFPFTTTLFASTALTTMKSLTGATIPFNHRLDYVAQALIARKITDALSIQLMPSYIHHNYVESADQVNDILAVGVGGRIKVSNRIALTGEYYYRLNGTNVSGYYNSLSFGVDIETGGHVFQIMLTNSNPMIAKGFISETTGSWADGGVHLGFNISRIFYLKQYQPEASDWQ